MSNGTNLAERLSYEQRAVLAMKTARRNRALGGETAIPAAERSEGGGSFRLSFAQQRLWFMEQFESESSKNNFINSYRIKGALEIEALEYALNQIVKRHEIWRTTFRYTGGEAMQVVSAEQHVKIERIDMDGREEEEVRDLISEIARVRFDLSEGPLAKAYIVGLSADERLFLWKTHHIVNDGWSIENFVNELESFYIQYTERREADLPELPVQYADFSVWQRDWLRGEVLENQIYYWKRKLGGELPILELPTDRPRQAVKTTGAGQAYRTVPSGLTGRLKEVGRAGGCTAFMALLAVFNVLLYRYTGLTDILVGSPVANRRRHELEKLIGFFANTLVFRNRLDGEMSFSELLDGIRDTTLEAYEHQDVPFEKLVDELHVKRDLSNTPIFQVMFVYENRPDRVPMLPGLAIEPFEIEAESGSFDMTLYIVEAPEGLKLRLAYNPDLFNSDTAERFLGHFERLMQSAASDPQRPIAELEMLSGEERLLMAGWNRTEAELGEERCIHELFEEQAGLDPDAIAVHYEGESLTYGGLNARANRLANYLNVQGIGPGDRVAVYMDRSLEIMTAILGVLKAGAAYVPVDPVYPRDRVAYMLEESAAKLVVTTASQEAELEGMTGIGSFCMDTQWNRLEGYGGENLRKKAGSSDGAYLIFTSGSTGRPKGVVIDHGNIVNYARGVLARLDAPRGLSFAVVTTFAADLGLTALWGALCSGGRLHVISYDRAADPEALAEYFRQNRIDVLKIVPSHFEALKAAPKLEDVIPHRYLIFGGEACGWETIARIRAVRPECEVFNHYGPTETTVGVLTCKISEIPGPGAGRSVPLGRPLPNSRAYVLDSLLQPVPIGVTGELYIAGKGVTGGYLNRPELTAEKFLPDLFTGEPGKCMYRTGDLARCLPDGNIEFLGRGDGQVKIRGYRVETGEIEALLKSYPPLLDAVVGVREDKPGDKRLVAYYVLEKKKETEFSVTNLREYLKKFLPDYMIPQAYVPLMSIPLTANGKVDRRALPAPDPSRREEGEGFVGPRNGEEARLAKIWSDVLKIDKIGIDDNFFDLGGDSFMAIRVVRSISGRLGVMELFRHPTIRELAVFLAKRRSADREMLHELTKPVPTGKRTASLVCIPYGGASAITYQPLANVLPKGYSLYAVELPGHDFSRPEEELMPVKEASLRCAEEIRKKIRGPVILYGQCLGGAIAIELAYLLERSGVKVDGVFIGAMFPSPRISNWFFNLWSRVFPSVLPEKGYRDLLKSVGGLNDSLSPAETKFMLRNLRHDSVQTDEYFTEIYKNRDIPKLRAPITCIVGGSDRMCEFYQERYREWEDFSRQVDLRVIANAGHYFQKYQAGELSAILREKIDDWQGRNGQRAETVPEAAADPAGAIGSRTGGKTVRPSMSLFMVLSFGQIISSLGSILSGFATGIWVYRQSGAVSDFAMIFLFGLLPTIILLPFAGAIVDRKDRRLILIMCDAVCFLASSGLFVLLAADSLMLWHVYVFTVMGSMANAFRRPAYLAAVTQIVPKLYLVQANGISQFAGAIGGILAPICGGIFMDSIGFKNIVLIDAFTFVVAIAALLSVRFPDTMFRKLEEPILKEIAGGWNYIVKRKSLIAMVVFFMVCNFLESTFDVITTPLILSFAEPSMLGIISAFSGVGVLVGSSLMSIFGGVRKRAQGMVGFVLFSGLSILLAGLRPSPLTMIPAIFGFGLSVIVVDIHWQSLIQVKVGLELQGRVFAINQMLAWSMRPVSYIMGARLADNIFEPLMRGTNAVSSAAGSVIGMGAGRGMGMMAVILGLLLMVWTVIGYRYKPLSRMDDILPDAAPDAVIIRDRDKLQEMADKKLLSVSGGKGAVL